MNHYLTYQDDTSDKFWQIKIQENSFTVVYGRRGSAGQSQTKTFDSVEKCQKEAEKLLTEKRKKGYVEEGYEGTVPTHKAKNVTPKKDNLTEVLAEYDELIKKKKISGLLPFLQQLYKGHYEPLRKHIRKAKRHWMDYVELQNKGMIGNSWGYRGDELQRRMVTLSAIALYDKTEIASWNEAYSIFQQTGDNHVRDILLWSKPSWIDEYLLSESLKSEWATLEYPKLRGLEYLQLIKYNPHLYARSLGSYNSYSSNYKMAQDYIDYICNDETAIKRDIPYLFNYETNIQNCFGNDNVYKWRGIGVWEAILNRLLAERRIDRMWFLESCLQVQTKEWNNGLKSFFRKRFEEAHPTQNELVSIQMNVFMMLHASYNQVANFGVSLIKDCYDAEGFELHAFLDWIAPVMMREDCKGSLKTLLTMFEKIIKRRMDLSDKILELTTDVFAVNDLPLQEKAAKLIQKYARKDHDELIEKLGLYAPQFLGNVSGLLSEFNMKSADLDVNSPQEEYRFSIKKIPVLLKDNEVKMPENWNDILFHIGRFIESADIVDDEILMNLLIVARSNFPADYHKQSLVYLKKMEKTYYASLFKNLTKDFTIGQLSISPIDFVKPNYFQWNKIPTVGVQFDRLIHVKQKIANFSKLPLLSLPTHTPSWIAPKVLIERLIAYQNANEAINQLDLAIAIARMPREQTEEAIFLCDQLEGELQPLIKFCLGVSDEILPANKRFWSLSFLGKKLINFNEDSYNAIWALAARTYYPKKTFTEFDKTGFGDAPFVSTPFDFKPYFKEEWNEWKNYQTGEMQRSPPWMSLKIDLSYSKNLPQPLLYSLDAYHKKTEYYYYLQKDDVVFWSGLTPQFLNPLFLTIINTTCRVADGGNSPVEGGLMILLRENTVFSDIILLFLACACVQQKRETRGLAAEVLIHHFQNQSIEPEKLGERLGFLLSNKYAPIARLTEVIGLVKDVSSLHNQALALLLEDLLLAFENTKDFPTNFKKLLEVYFDILTKTKKRPKLKLLALIESWQSTNALRNICKQIITL